MNGELMSEFDDVSMSEMMSLCLILDNFLENINLNFIHCYNKVHHATPNVI